MNKLDELCSQASHNSSLIKTPADMAAQPSSGENAHCQGWRGIAGAKGSLYEASFPGHAGNTLAQIKLIMYDLSTAFASDGHYVLSTAHLYRALRAKKLLNCVWDDMELAIRAYSPKDPLVANPAQPYDEEKACRHYMLALGMSQGEVSECALRKAQRQGKSYVDVTPRHDVRTIKVSSPLLDALIERATREHNKQSHMKTFEAAQRPSRSPMTFLCPNTRT